MVLQPYTEIYTLVHALREETAEKTEATGECVELLHDAFQGQGFFQQCHGDSPTFAGL